MTAEDMRIDSRLQKQHSPDHTRMADGDKVLPDLFFGSAGRQRWLQSIPCILALLCAGLTMPQDWRWGLVLLVVLLAWLVWRCPWSLRTNQDMPKALLSGRDGGLQVRMDSGSVLPVHLRARPFLRPRLGLIPLRSGDGRRAVLIGLFAAGDDPWRRWRLRLRQEWDAKTETADPAG
ncbi:hypothetical protein [Acidithiobacillus ferridurans]|uniref:hypothetical protein n=1 Tax=Acidithiobacillus ferridurans TaxID=1232575 RepID=UPI001C07C34B|nr:hypothetical protein [Acidithiobacillus ferridurans]MBU2734032.1 hypothetical protein [Acidithiobacillus ferridurans]